LILGVWCTVADTLEIRLRSASTLRTAAPSTIDFKRLLAPLVKDIADAAAIEAGIEPYSAGRDRRGEAGEPLILALAKISEPDGPGSGANYNFTVGPVAINAIGQITAGLAGRPDSYVVPDAARHVRDGLNRIIHRGLSVQLVNGVATPEFSSDNPPPPIAVHPTRELESEVAVKLLWVGGKKPSARVELLGSKQNVSVRLSGPTAARELGHHLYHNAVLFGRGEWVIDPKQFFRPTRLLAFKATGYRLLQPVSPEALFDRLAAAAGGVWDDTDPGKFREEDQEEIPESSAP
jgi:hypothetical protein